MGSVSSSVLVKMEVQILAFSLNLLSPLGTGEAHDRQLGGRWSVLTAVFVGGSCGENRGCEQQLATAFLNL